MVVDILTEIVIYKPLGVVAPFAAEPDNAPAWYENINAVEWKSAPPLRVGSRVAFVAQFLGRRLEYTYDIAEYKSGERLVMRTSQGPFPMETTYTWASTNTDGTRMTLRNRGEPTGFSSLAAPFIAVAMRKANRKDLDKLKAILESPRP